jgi:branched-chain amino acid transport system permease protein
MASGFVISAGDFKTLTGLAEGLAIKTTQAVTVVTALVVMGLLFWFLQKTRTGKSMRAFSDNEDLALLSGINPDRVVAVTWIIAAALGDHCGCALRIGQELQALHLFPAAAADLCRRHRGWPWQPAGRHRGRLRHRLFRGDGDLCLEEGAHYLVPESMAPDGLLQLLSTDYKFAVSFTILILVLLFMPTGLFKGKSV